MPSTAREEISRGDRFAFGENWRRFLKDVTPDTVATAKQSLCEMLGSADLKGWTFLDIGSGSGLFSFAAHQLGAAVASFDYDPESLACTRELRRQSGEPESWMVREGSILDRDFIRALGTFDVVYAWGVLHHTGRLWDALDNAASLVAPRGKLYVAIYNDEGAASRIWANIKERYNRSGRLGRLALLAAVWLRHQMRLAKTLLVKRLFRLPTGDGRDLDRGMNFRASLVDWVGGWPFEVAKPEQVFEFLSTRGFQLQKLVTCGGYGCNEFVFVRTSRPA